jgi:hypothetical protein
MLFSSRMVSEIVQPFWAALQRGEFITGAAESVGSYRVQGRRWIVAARCTKFATPFKVLAPHTDPGGLGIIGNRLYLSEFGFVHTTKVQSMPLSGGGLTTLLTGFKHETFVGLGTNGGLGLRRRTGHRPRHGTRVRGQAVTPYLRRGVASAAPPPFRSPEVHYPPAYVECAACERRVVVPRQSSQNRNLARPRAFVAAGAGGASWTRDAKPHDPRRSTCTA